MKALGVVISGTMIKTAVVACSGEISQRKNHATSRDLKNQILTIITEEISSDSVSSIRIATAGTLFRGV
ncbi:hypothetical protein [Mesotoga sp. H07.pep.5.3]|jgi:predicted NBD/HSP70 family sugar kinase|uniref:hypothetical protein n=1 Tax=Mesotoga sp. H07.pep.5.3 TaxID=1421003 RepID=UPI000C19ABCF|nr:hypothetical protein [Mesotoga sp. H07.pep.5.3]PIJ63540.1 ROK family transcriptional regulator [Mesotoga sp. H07.pep.5.3]